MLENEEIMLDNEEANFPLRGNRISGISGIYKCFSKARKSQK